MASPVRPCSPPPHSVAPRSRRSPPRLITSPPPPADLRGLRGKPRHCGRGSAGKFQRGGRGRHRLCRHVGVRSFCRHDLEPATTPMDTHESLATGHGHGRCTIDFSRPGTPGDPERPGLQSLYVIIASAPERSGRCPFVPRAGTRRGNTSLTREPVSGIEPLTCRLQEVCFVAICTLTALMPHVIAPMALTELGFPGGSSHAAEQQLTRTCNAA